MGAAGDEDPPPLRELDPALPEEPARIVQRAMHKDKEQRFDFAARRR